MDTGRSSLPSRETISPMSAPPGRELLQKEDRAPSFRRAFLSSAWQFLRRNVKMRAVILLLLILCFMIVGDVSKRYIIVSRMYVTSMPQNDLPSEDIITSKLYDQIRKILRVAHNALDYNIGLNLTKVNLKIPSTDLTYDLIVAFLKKIFNRDDIYVTGEISNKGGRYRVQATIENDTDVVSFALPEDPSTTGYADLNSLLAALSERIMFTLRPDVLALYKDNTSPPLGKGRLDYTEAIAVSEKILDSSKGEFHRYTTYLLSWLYYRNKEYDKALAKCHTIAYKRSLGDCFPALDAKAYDILGLCLQQKSWKEPDRAKKILLLRKAIANFELSIALAGDCYASNNLGNALLDLLLLTDVGSAPPLRYEARAIIKDAQSHYRDSARGDRNHPYPLLGLGDSYLRLGDLEEAGRYYAKALAIDQNLSPAHIGLGYIALRQGDTALAADELTKAQEYDPDNILPLLCAADCRFSNGDIAAAIDCSERALEIDANSTIAMNKRGWFLLAQGRRDEARIQFDRVLQFDSAFVPAVNGLGYCDLAGNQNDAALRRFQESTRLRNTDNPSAYLGLGIVLRGRGDGVMARDAFRNATGLYGKLTGSAWNRTAPGPPLDGELRECSPESPESVTILYRENQGYEYASFH